MSAQTTNVQSDQPKLSAPITKPSHIQTRQSFSNIPTEPIVKNKTLLYLWSIGVAMGSFVMGYLFVIITVLNSSITHFMTYSFSKQTDDSISIIPEQYVSKLAISENMSLYISICTTCLPLGGLIGSLFYRKIIKFIGSQNRLLIYCDLALMVLFISQLINLNVFQLAFTRFLQGIMIGISGVIVPTYLMSISPTKMSGKIGSLNQIMITIGIALGYGMGYKIDQNQLDNPLNWRIIMCAPILMCVVRISVCKIFPFDTLQRHIQNRQWQKLHDFLENFYDETSFGVEDLIKSKTFDVKKLAKSIKISRNNLQQSDQTEESNKEIKMIQMKSQDKLATKKTKKSGDYEYQQSAPQQHHQSSGNNIIIALSVVLCILNQFSGINAILFYSNQLFLNISHGDTDYAVKKSLQLGIFQIVVTLLSGSFMDNFGRRTLMLFGDLLIIASLLSCYYMLDFDSSSQWDPLYVTYAIFLHIGGFSLSLGPVTVVYISQIVQDISPYMTLIWIFTIFIALTSNIMIQSLGVGKAFLIYGIVSAIGLVYVFRSMIQTKGKTRKTIRQIFDKMGSKDHNKGGIMGISLDLDITNLGNKNYLKITTNDAELIQSNQ